MQNVKSNTGLTRIGSPIDSKAATIAIIGCGRGGTSACSTALHQLGVFMGDNAHPPTYEDFHLSSALESQDFPRAKRIVDAYNKKHELWAFKRPSAVGYLPTLHTLLRNPKYVFVFRDPQSVSFRIAQTEQISHLDALSLVLRNYGLMETFIRDVKPDGILVSYEKLLLNPSHFISELVAIGGMKPPPQSAILRIGKSIRPSPSSYVSKIRATNLVGHIDHISARNVSGWIGLRGSPRVCQVEIWYGQDLIAEATANLPRPDVKATGIHPNHQCGFDVKIDSPPENFDQTKIHVRLRNSELGFSLDNRSD